MPGLKAIISADGSQMAREFRTMEGLAARAGKNIQTGLSGGNGHGGVKAGAMRETMVLMREIGRGNWSRVPGSLSILLSQLGVLKLLFKNSAAEARILAVALEKKAAASQLAALAANAQVKANVQTLASMRVVTAGELMAAKADEERAVAAVASANADRAKAVAATQAASAMEAEGAAASFALGPIGWLVVGVIALGTAAFFTIRHFVTLAKEARNLRDLMDVTTISFTDQAEAIKSATEAAQGFDDWLNKLADSENSVADAVEEALDAMREQSKFERELASERGASRKKLAQMDIAATEKELLLVTKAKLIANRKFEEDKAAAIAAEGALKNGGAQREGQLKNVGEHTKRAGKIVDAIQEAMLTATVGQVVNGQMGQTITAFPATASDKLSVKVDGKEFEMSLNEAKKAFNELASEETRLAKIQKELSDLVTEKKKLTENDLKEQKKLTKEAQKLQDKLNLDKKFLPQIAAAHHSGHGSISSLQSIGGGYVRMQDIAQKQLHHLARIDKAVTGGGVSRELPRGKAKY